MYTQYQGEKIEAESLVALWRAIKRAVGHERFALGKPNGDGLVEIILNEAPVAEAPVATIATGISPSNGFDSSALLARLGKPVEERDEADFADSMAKIQALIAKK